MKGKYLAQSVVVAAGGWLPQLLPGLPLKTTAHLIGINYWRVKSRREFYRPENGSPNLVICDDQGQVLYGLPGTDFPDAMKVSKLCEDFQANALFSLEYIWVCPWKI